MPGHRRIKDVNYDEDDFDEYGEADAAIGDDGMSSEDQAQMSNGVLAVKDALGSSIDATQKEIEEALWYYYFDVDKSVAYVRKQHTRSDPPPTTKPKPISRFDQAAQSAQTKHANGGPEDTIEQVWDSSIKEARHMALTLSHTTTESIMWSAVPKPCLAVMPHVPTHPKGKLLGGAADEPTGKPSKLATLAASRRKAREDKKTLAQDSRGPQGKEESSSAALLDKLSIRPRPQADTSSPIRTMNRQPDIANTSNNNFEEHTLRTYKRQKRQDPATEAQSLPEPVNQGEKDAAPHLEPPQRDLRTITSPFAAALLNPVKSSYADRKTGNSVYSLSYPSSHHKANTNPFSGPSPDDVVSKAQNKGSKQPTKTLDNPSTAKQIDNNPNTLINRVASIDVASSTATPTSNEMSTTPKPSTKTQSLDFSAELDRNPPPKSANFVVIGHVDHGKSTLMGQLLLSTSASPETQNQSRQHRAFAKLQSAAAQANKSSFALAWLLDSTPEERARGVTTDISQQSFTSPQGTRFTLLDAPGHADFVPNAIAGASQADFALLVVDAGENAFESGMGARGQTREHILLARALGLQRIVVAVNKMDSPAVSWREERFRAVDAQLSAFLTGAGFKRSNIAIVPCSGLTGANVVISTEAEKEMAWWRGGTLLAALEAFEPSSARTTRVTAPLRMTVSDVFRPAQQTASGAVSISGRIDAGAIQNGMQLLCQPSGETASVKSVDVDNEPAVFAMAGQIASVSVTGIDPVHLRAGDVICEAGKGKEIRNVRGFDVKVLAFEFLMPGSVEVHRGRLNAAASIAELVSVDAKDGPEEGSGKKKRRKPRVIKPGQVALIRVRLEDNAEKGLPLEPPDRVVLRAEGRTVAAGLLEDVDV